MEKNEWIERFVRKLERLGVVLSAVELVVMANELWPNSKDQSPEVAARDVFGEA